MKTGASAQKVLSEVKRQQQDEENQELWDRKRVSPITNVCTLSLLQILYKGMCEKLSSDAHPPKQNE